MLTWELSFRVTAKWIKYPSLVVLTPRTLADDPTNWLRTSRKQVDCAAVGLLVAPELAALLELSELGHENQIKNTAPRIAAVIHS